MKLIKKITAMPIFQKFLAWIGALYIKLVFKTSCFDYVHRRTLDHLIQSDALVMVAFWHGRMAILPCAWQWNRPFHMLLSKHRDGMMISRVLEHFNIKSIFGSTTRGGVGAGLQIIDKIREGAVIGFTPDGPRGPAQKCSMGIITLAHLTAKETGRDVHIIASSYAVKSHKTLRSWDRFMVPLPFSKGAIVVNPVAIIKADMTEENLHQHCHIVEEGLNRTQDEADEAVLSHSK